MFRSNSKDKRASAPDTPAMILVLTSEGKTHAKDSKAVREAGHGLSGRRNSSRPATSYMFILNFSLYLE